MRVLIYLLALGLTLGCDTREAVDATPKTLSFPASDPTNAAGWKLNTDISDEFEASALDEARWLIQGRNGVYQSNTIGRAPSQYSTKNVRLENGKLKLTARWEPDFNFSKTPQSDGTKYENITSAAVISKKLFQYGYMEIKCKAADASVTSSFWTTGTLSELDIFEFMGAPKQSNKKFLEKEYMFSIHDWSPAKKGATVWTSKVNLDWRVADDFHVYGCEWSENGLKFYADGKLVRSATKEEIGEGWVLDNPQRIWVNSVTFPWHGLPTAQDLPVDYEIEYIRVWQK